MRKKTSSPIVVFRYSDIYDFQCATHYRQSGATEPYPKAETVKAFKSKLERNWKKTEVAVLRAIEKITGLRLPEINQCYIVGNSVPFSDPLTIPVFKSFVPIDYATDVLCHEMIHRVFQDERFEKRWPKILKLLKKDFPTSSENTLVHVLVHAIHSIVYKKCFTEKRLARDKRMLNKYQEYKEAWGIVERVGAEKIIERYVKSI